MTERLIAAHAQAARRADDISIVRLNFTEHGVQGKYQQMWART